MRHIHLITILALLMVAPSICSAKKKTAENTYIIAERADGSRFEGYIVSNLDKPKSGGISKVKISEVFNGKPVEYTSDQVKRIIFPPLDTDSDSVIYEALTAKLKKYVLFEAQPTKKPLFLKRLYKGDNINGYLMVSATMVGSGFNMVSTARCLVYLYKPKDTETAIPYWQEYTYFHKPTMIKTLKDFPGLHKTINSWDFDEQAFFQDPAMLLPMMDKTYSPTAAEE